MSRTAAAKILIFSDQTQNYQSVNKLLASFLEKIEKLRKLKKILLRKLS